MQRAVRKLVFEDDKALLQWVCRDPGDSQ